MSSKGKSILKKRKEMLHEKLNQIAAESENIIELIHDIQIRATSMVSDLNLETDEHEFLLKYPTASKRLEEWQAQISRISYDLDVLACEENRGEPDESNTTSTRSEGRQEVLCKVEKTPSADDNVRLWIIPCPIQEHEILDMRFASGQGPHDFWLRFYSTKELNEITSIIQKLFEANKLQPLDSSEVLGGDVCVCNGGEYFRGRVVNQCADAALYTIRNVDNGGILKVEKSKMYRLTEELIKFPVQAINCCLEGDLGDPGLWDACVVKLFHQVMDDSSLVVTICSVPAETCSKFVVKVDTHNEMRTESKIDLSSWITHSVLPVLVQRSTGKSADNLQLLFDILCPKAEFGSSTATDCSYKTEDEERKEMKDSRIFCVKDNANSFPNSHKEKSDAQQQTLNAAQQCSSFLTFNSPPPVQVPSPKDKSNAVQQCSPLLTFNTPSSLHAMPPQKAKSNAAQQCSSFLSLNSTSAHEILSHKETSNVQQLQSVEQQSSAILNMRSSPPIHSLPPPTSHYIPHFSQLQNSPMLVQMNPLSVNQAMYPYASQMQPSLIGLPPFHNASLSVALQQQNQPHSFQFQVNSPVQNKLLTKQHTSQRLSAVSFKKFPHSKARDTQKDTGHKTHTFLEDQQKYPILTTKTWHIADKHVKTVSVTKQTPSVETESFKKDFSVSIQEMSPTKVNSKNRNGVSKGSLRYPDFKFETGGRYEALALHINNPDDFYVQVAYKKTAFIDTLEQEMTENYKTCSVKLKNKQQAKIMLYESWCAVFHKVENLWCRGKVINWKDDNDTELEVQYIDYGEVCQVDLSMIKPLKEEYTKLPICATRCRLANLHPAQLQDNTEHNIWPEETIELFRILAVKDKLHSIVVTDPSTDPISVVFVTEDAVVNKILLDMGYAIAFKPIEFDPNLPIQLIKENVEQDEKLNISALEKLAEKLQKEDRLKTAGDCPKVNDKDDNLKNWNPLADDYYSADNTEYHNDESACYAVLGYEPQDEKRICKFYAATGHCFKGVTCTKEHSRPNPHGWTTDREDVLQYHYNNVKLPPVDTLVTVEVIAIYKVHRFYAHIFWEGKTKEEEEETLLTLNKFLNSKDNVSKMKRFQTTPSVGQLVVAKFMADGYSSFYRARIIDTEIDESMVQVLYVDYGNTEWVSEKDIRQMEMQFIHLPFQALECYISDVKPKTDSEDALLDVSKLLLGKQLVGKIMSKEVFGDAKLELWDGDQKIADKLVEKGYADYAD